jgi:hypothetical protein
MALQICYQRQTEMTEGLVPRISRRITAKHMDRLLCHPEGTSVSHHAEQAELEKRSGLDWIDSPGVE